MLPSSVTLRELGPREGFQNISTVVPTARKLELIAALVASGVPEIEVTSFVRPDKVPQMADAEALVAQLPQANKTRYTALYLNSTGFDRARAAPLLTIEGWVYTATSETFLKRNNNRTIAQSLDEIPGWIQRFNTAGVPFHGLMISTAFGCNDEGRFSASQIIDLLGRALVRITDSGATPPREISLADTMGWGNPHLVEDAVRQLRTVAPQSRVSLHLHDTRGTGMANVYAGLQAGVDLFDGSVAGLGGCPFAPGAAGNVATEEVAFLCQELGIPTGIDLDALVRAALIAEDIVGSRLEGKFYRNFKGLVRC